MAIESIGLPFDVGSIAAWAVWIIPFIGALIIPAVGNSLQSVYNSPPIVSQ